jgi:tripartite-type tricarboxylate transporter receptor subunit TctC
MIVRLALLVVATLALPAGVFAQGFPARPVTIISNAGAGTSPDVVARVIAERLSQLWGQQVVVVNRPSGGGIIATRSAASAAPDGHTLYMAATSVFVLSPEEEAKAAIDLDRDFAKIGLVNEQPLIFAAAAKLGVNSLPELIALAKAKPGDVLYAGNTRGSLPHLAAELLSSRAGIQMTFVPYPAIPPALHDMMGGRIGMIVQSLSSLAGAIDGGAIKPLAVASQQRLSKLPDVPTVAETVPGFEALGWFVLMAPAKTPAGIVAKVRQDLRAVLDQGEVVQRFAGLGGYTRHLSPTELDAFVDRERRLWRTVAKQVGVTGQ